MYFWWRSKVFIALLKIIFYSKCESATELNATEIYNKFPHLQWFYDEAPSFMDYGRSPTPRRLKTTADWSETTMSPDTKAPNTIIPDTMAPDTMIPDTIAPDTMIPDTTFPNTMSPNTVTPDTMIPDTTPTNTINPDTMTADTMTTTTTATSTLTVSCPSKTSTSATDTYKPLIVVGKLRYKVNDSSSESSLLFNAFTPGNSDDQVTLPSTGEIMAPDYTQLFYTSHSPRLLTTLTDEKYLGLQEEVWSVNNTLDHKVLGTYDDARATLKDVHDYLIKDEVGTMSSPAGLNKAVPDTIAPDTEAPTETPETVAPDTEAPDTEAPNTIIEGSIMESSAENEGITKLYMRNQQELQGMSPAIFSRWRDYGYKKPSWFEPVFREKGKEMKISILTKAKEDMKKHKIGYISAFVSSLCNITASKKETALAKKLVSGADNVIHEYVRGGRVNNIGNITLKALQKYVEGLAAMPAAQIDALAERAYEMFRNHSSFEPDTQDILAELDDWYTKKQGDHILSKLGDVNTFPENKMTINEVVKQVIDALLKPLNIFSRNVDSSRNHLLNIIELAITRRSIYKTTKRTRFKDILDMDKKQRFNLKKRNHPVLHTARRIEFKKISTENTGYIERKKYGSKTVHKGQTGFHGRNYEGRYKGTHRYNKEMKRLKDNTDRNKEAKDKIYKKARIDNSKSSNSRKLVDNNNEQMKTFIGKMYKQLYKKLNVTKERRVNDKRKKNYKRNKAKNLTRKNFADRKNALINNNKIKEVNNRNRNNKRNRTDKNEIYNYHDQRIKLFIQKIYKQLNTALKNVNRIENFDILGIYGNHNQTRKDKKLQPDFEDVIII